MTQVIGIDHVAITVADMDATCAFYRDLFDAQTVAEHPPEGRVLVRQIALGGALLSVHQAGNGLELVAKHPTIGAADICLRWSGNIAEAVALLQRHGVEVTEGPTPRRTNDGLPSQSVYFRDRDGNLLELMAENSN